MKFTSRERTPLAAAALTAVRELRITLLHFNGARKSRSFRKTHDLRLNVGCGAKKKQGWVNIDLSVGADLSLNLRRRLPFSNESCSIVYSEHFLEHLAYPSEALLFLSESYRVLRPGGTLSTGVPDTEWPVRAYSDDVADYFTYAKELWHPKWCVTRMEHINYHFRQGEQHKFAYDCDALAQILDEVGFVNVTRHNYDPSIDSQDRGWVRYTSMLSNRWTKRCRDGLRSLQVAELSPRTIRSAGVWAVQVD